MTLVDLPSSELLSRAREYGLVFQAGRFNIRLHTRIPAVLKSLQLMYADQNLVDEPFADFTVRVTRGSGIRCCYHPQSVFSLNGARPFAPLPLAHAFPLLEWGLNWCVSQHCHQYLVIHAAVVEKHGRALILPGLPGSGKSTLSAALTGRGGWRLLSDELTLIDPKTGCVHANPRPISLKNASIERIRSYLPQAVLSPPVHDTVKGTVAHLRPPRESVLAQTNDAIPGAIVFPRFEKGAKLQLSEIGQGDTFMRMADNAFNYSILGAVAFRALTTLVEKSLCREFVYGGDLDSALECMESLVQQ